MTPNNELLRDLVREFADADPILGEWFDRSDHNAWPYSHTACRTISGSSTYSRHAWGDAGDVMRLTKGVSWGVAPKSKPDRQATPADPFDRATWGDWYPLDELYWWLLDNRQDLDLDNLIYRRRRSSGSWDHLDHIHLDFNHHGTGKPPCAGGTLRTVDPEGGFVLTAEVPGGGQPPAPGVPPKGDEMLTTLELQGALLAAGHDPGDQDGVMGPATFAAWVAGLSSGSWQDGDA